MKPVQILSQIMRSTSHRQIRLLVGQCDAALRKAHLSPDALESAMRQVNRVAQERRSQLAAELPTPAQEYLKRVNPLQ